MKGQEDQAGRLGQREEERTRRLRARRPKPIIEIHVNSFKN
jgi:hypothetical protein